LAIWAPLGLKQVEQERQSKLVLAASLEQNEQGQHSKVMLVALPEH